MYVVKEGSLQAWSRFMVNILLYSGGCTKNFTSPWISSKHHIHFSNLKSLIENLVIHQE